MREYIVRGSDFVLGAEQIQHPIVALAAVSIGIIRNRRYRSAQALCGDNQLPGQAPVLNRYETAPADLDTYNRSGMRIETGSTGFRVCRSPREPPLLKLGFNRATSSYRHRRLPRDNTQQVAVLCPGARGGGRLRESVAI
jgi:hypothetical protein